MSDKENLQQTTFWEFLKKNKIEIPIIQRDYAQGRIGKEKLRKNFLADLKNALDGKLPNNEEVLKLDFAYGNVENDRLNLLDGQQRLTTLWLLHWYIAHKAGILSVNNYIFKNFSYETRTTSREFCKKISEFDIISEDPIVEFIQKQTWFFSIWKQDPTIQAMLNMLGGTPIKDSNDNDILDGIEEVFNDCDYSSYWKRLTSEECPIVFYYIDLLDLKLSDDLYIKMNARGKPLTNFENFKADFVGFIKDKGYDNEKKHDETIAHKLDATWIDIFWKSRSTDYKIDDIYFAFINRYIINSLITNKKADDSDLYTQKEIESNKLFKYLYGKSGNDSKIKYDSFDLYKSEKDIFNEKLFERIEKTLDNFYKAFQKYSKEEINKLFFPLWDCQSNFRFIPEYVENPDAINDTNEPKYIPSSLTLSQRVVFYAVCSYFENYQYNEIEFMHWIRVVWNIVENANIGSIPSMIGTIRLIDEMKPNANNIHKFLSDGSTVIISETAKEQVEEEIEKAKQIVNDTKCNWKSKIISAEKTAFFKGKISFLFRTGIHTYDWSKFDNRFEKAKLYFDLNGATAIYKKDSILLRALISNFSEFDHFNGQIFDNDAISWKMILHNEKLINILNTIFDSTDILTYDFNSFTSSIKGNDKLRDFQNDLCKSTIITYFSPNSYFHWWNHDKYSIFPYNAKSQSKIFVLADIRNHVISVLDGDIIEVDDWHRVKDLPYFKGWDLSFTLKRNNKKYKWEYSLIEQTENGKWVDIPNVNLDNLETYLKELK